MRSRTVAAAVVGLTATALLASVPLTTSAEATGGTHGAAPAMFAPRAISWHKCADPDLKHAHAQCGMLVVPLDHADPASPTIRLAVSRVRHTREPYRGIVVTNPGGPGGSGTYLATLGQYVPGKVAQTYDWYGLDPRGVGASRPALTCDASYFGWDRPNYVPHNRSISRHWRHKTEKYAADCGKAAASELLPYLRTTDNAQDFDILRRTVGADELTFYGFSYGTYLAQVYANLYPNRVKAMVLDGVLDPTNVYYRSNLDQDRAFQVDQRRSSSPGSGSTPASTISATAGRRSSAATTACGTGWSGTLLEAGGARRARRRAAAGLLLPPVLHADGPGLVGAGQPRPPGRDRAALPGHQPGRAGADNLYSVYLATSCTDAPWPQDWATWREDNWRVHHQAPFFTWGNAWFNAPCRTWPVASQPRFDVSGKGVKAPILLTNETYDPATPFRGRSPCDGSSPASALVEGVGGTSHAASLSGIACIDNTVAALLRDGSSAAHRRRPRGQAVPRHPGPEPEGGRPDDPAPAAAGAGALVVRGYACQVRSQIVCGESMSRLSTSSESGSTASVTTYPCWPRVERYCPITLSPCSASAWLTPASTPGTLRCR